MIVHLWDGFIRSFHWLLALLFAALWITGGELNFIDWHQRLGLLLLALLITRVMWGIVGSSSARFSAFVQSPIKVWQYLPKVWRGQHEAQRSHNPAGGYMILLMLGLLVLQVISGLFTDDDIFFRGPLAHWVDSDTARWLTGFHKSNFNWLAAAVIFHIIAIVYYLLRGHDLITPMITGKKAPSQEQASDSSEANEAKTKTDQSAQQSTQQSSNGIEQPAVKIVHGGWGFLILAVNLVWVFWWLG